MSPSDDIRYLGERIDNLRESMSEVGRALHGHLDQIEGLIDREPAWWVRPAKSGLYVLMFVVGLLVLGWGAKESLLPEGALERFIDAGLNAMQKVE